jgi:hypothetical protein
MSRIAKVRGNRWLIMRDISFISISRPTRGSVSEFRRFRVLCEVPESGEFEMKGIY